MRKISSDVLKAAVSPLCYYTVALPTLPAPKREGWVPGGLCPFHADRHHGNFRINTLTGAFTCFACDARGGDIIAFHMLQQGVDFRKALDDLAVRYLSQAGSL